MIHKNQPNNTPLPLAESAQQVLARHGLTGWPALHALVEFSGSPEALIAHCVGLGQEGAASRLDDFLTARAGRVDEAHTYPEYLPISDDLRDVARGALESFVAMEVESLFLGSHSSSMSRELGRFDRACECLGGHARGEVIALVERRFAEEMKDAWELHKFASVLEWPTPPDLDAIERYASTIPEEQWGGNEVHGLTPDLEEALRSALREKGAAAGSESA